MRSTYKPKVYGASKINLWADWLIWRLDFPEVEFTNRWPDVVNVRDGVDCKDSPEFSARCWIVDFQDIQRADCLILVCPATDKEHLRGALVETGYALALAKPIYIVGNHPDLGTWSKHPMVRKHEFMAQAIADIAEIYS